ncbi:hypothetical protein Poli38472_007138 [Pythium oligandrum]|uniref:Short-chain dehydrogenase n=1 Tax=Pythium oligandrum TaxID=41045 RepID=A0A8K1FHQ4_PYTOL|nr:hypothetical protein Poli38472_007138 [Pythium oligandrum]|eukprot:TMW58993.1 hypothetical protein Poli38472_007138 [Pythium oligandrum]
MTATPATNTNTILITGSSRGIGLALAKQYHAAGWNVIAAARNPANSKELQQLNVYKTVQLDVSDEASILRAAKELEGEAIDVLVNNAAIGAPNTLQATTKTEFVDAFEVNVVGPFLVSRAFVPHLKAAVAVKGFATIAQITSMLGSITLSTGDLLFPAYRTTKAALNMLNNVIAHELKSDNINAVVICPGSVATDLNGHTGILQPADSAARIVKNIARANAETTGHYFSHEGGEYPW